MIVCAGPTGVPKTFSTREVPIVVKSQPVETLAPTVYDPPEFTVNAVPALAVRVPLVAPLLSVKNRSLRFCATSVGFDSRLFNVTVTVPAPVTKIADASSALPPDEVPLPMKVMVDPSAAEARASITASADDNSRICETSLRTNACRSDAPTE